MATPPPPPAPPSPPAPPAPAGQSPVLQVPPDVAAKFGDVIKMIQASESMNADERQYWVNILPIMTPEQLQSLRDILENEKKQLASIDEKYATQIDQASAAQSIQQTDDQRRKRREQRQTQESAHREQEQKAADALLEQMDSADQNKKIA